MSSSPVLSVRLGRELKQLWVEHCTKHGTTPSSGIQQVKRHLTAKSGQAMLSGKRTEIQEHADRTRRRLEVRLTASEHSSIQDSARQEGVSSNQWVINLIRVNLVARPQLGMEELRVLGESNSRLLALGRNLNQIARQINTNPVAHERLKTEQIEALSRHITTHTAQVANVMRANIDRWTVK
jgi:predicted HicB family RNase H-like nuclease